MKFSGGQAMTQREVKALLKAPTVQAAMIFLLGLAAFGYSTLVVLRGDITESARCRSQSCKGCATINVRARIH